MLIKSVQMETQENLDSVGIVHNQLVKMDAAVEEDIMVEMLELHMRRLAVADPVL